MENNEKVTIVVNSCDLYEDTWEPFLKLFSIQWPDCPYKIVLNTETKVYTGKTLPVTTINTKKGISWSARMKKVAKQINSEYIMFFLDDEFLRSPVNVKAFEDTIEYMDNNKDVGYILMRHSEKQKSEFAQPYFPRAEITDDFQIVGLSALYRKDFMLKILRNHESVWEYELYATKRMKRYPYKVLQYNKNMPMIFDYDDSTKTGYGVHKRKWLKATKPLLDSFGIEVKIENEK